MTDTAVLRFLGALVCVTLGCTESSIGGRDSGSPTDSSLSPNVLVVMVDALRQDHLGLYGYAEPTSPYLDGIADQALVFEQAYSHGSQTFYSTASLLTSKFFPVTFRADIPPEERARFGRPSVLAPLAPPNVAFPQAFAANGYSTVGIFTNPHHHPNSGFPDLFEETVMLPRGRIPYADGRKVNWAYLDWLSDIDCDTPFLGYVHYMDVHNPYKPPAAYAKLFVTADGKNKYTNAIPTGADVPTEQDLRFMIQNYDAGIRYVDTLIREIHEATLRQCSRETILVVTSDHGDEFMDHGGLGHGRTLEKELVRIPLLIHGAPDLPPVRYPHLVRQVDIGPTLLALAGFRPPTTWDGTNLLPLLAEASGSPGPVSSIARHGSKISLTTSGWHAIWDLDDGAVTLYDNLRDPAGLLDVAAERANVMDKLEQRLQPFLAELLAVNIRARTLREEFRSRNLYSQSEQEALEQLRALGYVR